MKLAGAPTLCESGKSPPDSLAAYYSDPAVRLRIAEFLGGTPLAEADCRYITADDRETCLRQPRPTTDLWDCLDEGLEISRSLWDRRSLIAHLDMEYVNFDHPAEAYEDPSRTFSLQYLVQKAIGELLGHHGIYPLKVMSGRGYHFAWKIGWPSPLALDLARIGHCSSGLEKFNRQPHPVNGRMIDPQMALAFSGLGLVMEWVAHRIMAQTPHLCPIPIEITAVEVGPGLHDREMISLDLSTFGDPLQTRTLRVPFTIYHKPTQQHWLIDRETLRKLPRLLLIPVNGLSLAESLEVRTSPARAANWATRISTSIPEHTRGTENLLVDYLRSPLAEFHRWFYTEEPYPREHWQDTYDQTPLDMLPHCVRRLLEQPNDLLLHPGSMRLVTRVFLALGWHPRHIAGLITSKFTHDYGWGEQWTDYDPATRADFYVRVFAGLIAVGTDSLVDFNCRSVQEQHLCPFTECPFNLEKFCERALERKQHD